MIRRHRPLTAAGTAVLAAVLVAAVLFAAVVLPDPRVVPVPAGLLLALVLPGAAATAALFAGRQVTRVERLVLVPALSLGLLVLGGLALSASGVPLTRWSWAALTAGTTALAAIVAHLRRRRTPTPHPARWAPQRTLRGLLPLALAAALLGGAAWVSVASAHAQWAGTTVTALSMTSTGQATGGSRTASVSVHGGGSYLVRLTGPDGYSASVGATTDASGSWSATLTVPATERITADLYRATDSTPYRTVYLEGASALAGS